MEYNAKLQWQISVIYPTHYGPKLHKFLSIYKLTKKNNIINQSDEECPYHPWCHLHRWVFLNNFILHLWPRPLCIITICIRNMEKHSLHVWMRKKKLILKLLRQDDTKSAKPELYTEYHVHFTALEISWSFVARFIIQCREIFIF